MSRKHSKPDRYRGVGLGKAIRVTILLVVASLIYGGLDLSSALNKLSDHTKEINLTTFNKVVFYHRLLGVKFPEVATAQSRLETASYTSNICKENNNWHGMKHDPNCYSLGTRRGHAYYATPFHSILSYKCWQEKRLRDNPGVETIEDYLKMLNGYKIPGICNPCRYAEDRNYVKKIRKILKDNNVEF
jgi:hypothetical protein